MPLISGIGSGGQATTNGRVFYRETMRFAAGDADGLSTPAIEVIGLSNLTFFVLQASGVGSIFRPQFSASSADGPGLVPIQEWFDFQPAMILPDGGTGLNPAIKAYKVACRFVRVTVNPAAAALGAQVKILILTSS